MNTFNKLHHFENKCSMYVPIYYIHLHIIVTVHIHMYIDTVKQKFCPLMVILFNPCVQGSAYVLNIQRPVLDVLQHCMSTILISRTQQ